MEDVQSSIVELGIALAEATARSTATAVTDKIKTIRANKNKDEQIAGYRQIINELQENKADLQDISNQYKEIVERINISDEDIEALHKTIAKVMNILIEVVGYGEESDTVKEVNALISLLDSDTLKTLQLIGFNYKRAIGEPLTEITSKYIQNMFNNSQNEN